jgi:hypothetical protein
MVGQKIYAILRATDDGDEQTVDFVTLPKYHPRHGVQNYSAPELLEEAKNAYVLWRSVLTKVIDDLGTSSFAQFLIKFYDAAPANTDEIELIEVS